MTENIICRRCICDLCGNPASEFEEYALPVMEDCYAENRKGVKLQKISRLLNKHVLLCPDCKEIAGVWIGRLFNDLQAD